MNIKVKLDFPLETLVWDIWYSAATVTIKQMFALDDQNPIY